MKLVLIAGKSNSGKTKTANMLKDKLQKMGKKVAVTEYSKYIKLFAKELTEWDGSSLPKPRKFLQNFGSFIRHDFENEKYFIMRMKEDIKIYENFVDILIISDIRLIDEIEELSYLNPIKIKIINEGNLYNLDEDERNHETETAIDQYDNFNYIIKNKSEKEISIILDEIIKEETIWEFF